MVYVTSDDRTCAEVARVLGNAVGLPNLTWLTLTDEETRKGLEAAGVPPHAAANLVELGAAIHGGLLREDYDRHESVRGTVTLEEFAREFAANYNQPPAH